MTQEDDAKIRVGRALRARRLDLGLSQEELARKAKTSERSIGSAERGESAIQLRKRGAWEEALHLQRGAISRAYRTGAELETIDIAGVPELGPEDWTPLELDMYQAPEFADDEAAARRLVNAYRKIKGRPERQNWSTPPDAQRRGRLA